MLPSATYVNPFSTDGLLNIPELDLERSTAWQAFYPDTKIESGRFKLAEIKSEPLPDLQSQLFQLDLQDVPLPELDSSISSETASDDEHETSEETSQSKAKLEEDVWALPYVQKRSGDNKLISWDNFLNGEQVEPNSAYLSEFGADAFYAVLHLTSKTRNDLAPRVVKPDILLYSLFELAIGCGSALFRFDATTTTFVRIEDSYVAPGLTVEATNAIIQSTVHTGNQTRKFMELVDGIVANARRANGATGVAIASCVSSVMFGIRVFLEASRNKTESLMQLQALLDRPSILVDALTKLRSIFEDTAALHNIVDHLSKHVQVIVEAHPWSEDILQEIVRRTLTPLLAETATSIGLRSCSSDTGTGQLPHSDADGNGTVVLRKSLPVEIERMVNESNSALSLLRSHSPNHQLLYHRRVVTGGEVALSIEYSWEEINRIRNRAKAYEEELKLAVLDLKKRNGQGDRKYAKDEGDENQSSCFGRQAGSNPFDVQAALSTPLSSDSSLGKSLAMVQQDRLFHLVIQSFDNPETGKVAVELNPSIAEAVSFSLMPLLTAQHRLLSYAVFQLLFETAQVRTHLNLQSRLQLLRDGAFTSRLSQYLFDVDQASGEGRRIAGSHVGLRLQSRITWPPASSELRLVLMGVLSESMSRHTKDSSIYKLESISFAIRDLSDEELEKCRDAGSIHALDFLRLQYKPTNSLLEAIITPASLKKYDRVFMHLLRLLRVQCVAQGLLREVSNRRSHSYLRRGDRQFRIDIHHFISTFADYSQSIAIRIPWQRLDSKLKQIESSLEQHDYENTLMFGGLERLRHLHEGVLDEITRCLFLNKRQLEARTLVEELFGLVLRLAASTMTEDSDDDTKRRMHAEFKQGVGRFVKYLRAQSNASSMNTRSDNEEVTTAAFEQLLTRLDLFGYWSRDR